MLVAQQIHALLISGRLGQYSEVSSKYNIASAANEEACSREGRHINVEAMTNMLCKAKGNPDVTRRWPQRNRRPSCGCAASAEQIFALNSTAHLKEGSHAQACRTVVHLGEPGPDLHPDGDRH